MSDDKNEKSKLTTALTNAAQPGVKKGGGLLGALGGGVPAARTHHQVQHVAKQTLNALDVARKSIKSGEAGHMAYIIDATASRSETWEQAQQLQAGMFRKAGKAGDLHVRLIHFGGGAVSDKGWFNNAASLAGVMKPVECRSGRTQIAEAVAKVLEGGKLPRTVVLIGDSFEEEKHDLMRSAASLAAKGIKVFAFLDVLGGIHGGEEAFRTLAAKTGGAFEYFGRGMNLDALCEAAATYTTGGDDALKKLAQTSKEARAIGQQVLRLSGPSGPKGPQAP